ncbi:MAG: class I SAM-dependent methyltransferase [Candidatus Moranbacteria bacterium]|jgi:SAM-dependent methyltransferase|nr:class I SAM-dependent methyltransferase [Candidatus Moranbacteria bacterium]MBP7822290.1 class I SAM-dependent methyltransferase [Candidatus Moranbacteria bacterium]
MASYQNQDKNATMSLIEKIATIFSSRSRKNKYSQFITECRPTPEDSILDIGVNTREYSPFDNYLEKQYPHKKNITAIGLEEGSSFKSLYPEITYLQADGRELPFKNNQFDLVYSNAVLEHVGTREQQCDFLRELLRVGKRGYITTPNRFFPVEVHTRVPLLHILLPKSLFDAFLSLIGKDWATGNYMNLLSEKELRLLLDAAGISDYSLLRNRFLGLTMTFTVIWKKHPLI